MQIEYRISSLLEYYVQMRIIFAPNDYLCTDEKVATDNRFVNTVKEEIMVIGRSEPHILPFGT